MLDVISLDQLEASDRPETLLNQLDPALRDRLLSTEVGIPAAVDTAVSDIIADIRARGDAALVDYTQQFDGVDLATTGVLLSSSALRRSAEAASRQTRRAIEGMIANVRRFHERQHRSGYSIDGPQGTVLRWRLRPVGSAAVYVPGGLAAYPTTVVMNVVPALIAGVRRIMVLTPPGSVENNPAIAYALQTLDVHEVVTVGGAQAIAAAAFGTQSVRPVDVIVGPGNVYVAAAKRQVFGRVGIDSVAGPSEVVVVADASAPATWIARDLLAQAEHDPRARCVLITTDVSLATSVSSALTDLLAHMPRAEIARASLTDHGALIAVPDLASAVAISNAIAPEHLQVMLDDNTELTPDDFVAGAIFWGAFSPTAVGDYWAGPNHVLPTGGSARYRGPLGVDDFLVASSVVHYSKSAAQSKLESAVHLAELEGLWAHAAALSCRAEADPAREGDLEERGESS